MGHIELQQSRSSSELTDSIRAGQQWAEAESASWPEASIKVVAKMVKESEGATYYRAFLDKDLRRAEYELFKLFK